MRLAGKVALVTGGASGIGLAIVRRFLQEGARVYLADMPNGAGEDIARSEGAQWLPLDVSLPQDWQRAHDHLAVQDGRLDVIVNNAGILGASANAETVELEDWNRVMAVNVTGVMLGCKHAIALMRKNPAGPSGSIINLSSVAALTASRSLAYSTSKGAVRLMTKSIAVDMALQGLPIRCNSIHPGAVDTPIFDARRRNAGPEELRRLESALLVQIPMGRLGRADEIASMALFLASDESTFSTGSEFVADGGGSAGLATLRPELY